MTKLKPWKRLSKYSRVFPAQRLLIREAEGLDVSAETLTEDCAVRLDELTTLVKDIADRARRVETRQAKYLESIGFETGVRKPVWVQTNDGASIEVPSPATSLVDCLSVVPPLWDQDEEIDVTYRGTLLGSVLKP